MRPRRRLGPGAAEPRGEAAARAAGAALATSALAFMLALLLPAAGCGLARQAGPAGGAGAGAGEAGGPRLEPLWTVAAAAGGEGFDLALGWVRDRDGRSYVLEYPSARVRVYSPGGVLERTLARHTGGPRAVSEAQALVLLPDSTLGLVLPAPALLFKLDRRGNLTGRAAIAPADGRRGTTTTVRRAACAGGVLALGGTDARLEETRGQVRAHFVRRYGVNGEILATYATRETVVDMASRRFTERDALAPFTLSFAVGPDGRVYVAPDRDAYRIEVFAPEGELERVIERPFQPRARTAADSARVRVLFDAWAQEVPVGITYAFEPAEPAIIEMQADALGRLWVLHSRSRDDLGDDSIAAYDVFEPDGRFAGAVTPRIDGAAAGVKGTRGLAGGAVQWLDAGRAALLGRAADAEWLRGGGRLGLLAAHGLAAPPDSVRGALCRIAQ